MFLSALFLAAIILPGCEFRGIGVGGEITLGSEVDSADFQTLELRAYPDSDEEFDPAAARISEREELLTDSVPLDEIVFPYTYRIQAATGTSTEKRHWRVVGWLSSNAGSDEPMSGEYCGTATFNVQKCGVHGGYCAETYGVGFTIDRQVQ